MQTSTELSRTTLFDSGTNQNLPDVSTVKFNLKNRSKHNELSSMKDCRKTEEWFEGFEKELRDKIQEINNQHSEGPFYCRACDLIQLVKEILGE